MYKISVYLYVTTVSRNLYLCLCVCVCVQNEFSDVEDLEEDEFESGFEDMKTDEEYEAELDPHSSKFRAEGQLMAYEEEPNFEGYLSVRVCTILSSIVGNFLVW